MDPSTTKFHNARPYAVLPISPALAALYTSQTSSSSLENTEWCSRCSSYLSNGGAEVRIVRLKPRKGRPMRRAVRTICRGCRWNADVPVKSAGIAIDVPPLHNLISPTTSSRSIPPSRQSPPPNSGQESSVQAKARNKKKSGLQLLLLKNREKETKEQKGSPASGGLTAFLSGL